MKVSKCCCGCSLHDGCLIIGILQLIFTCIGTVVCIIILASSSFLQKIVDQYCSGEYNTTDLDDDFCNSDPISAMKITIGVYLAISLLSVVVGALLVHGTRTRNPGLLLPWMVMTGLSIIANIVMNIVQIVTVGSQAILGAVISILLTLCISGYFLLVVHSYRKELKENAVGGNYGNQYGYKN
eukprot:TRINITY_DN1866_c2_g1_i2.p1 TRINITY_DN1866_c2_g1~~TRINITY_DN1866_c2_g1_i2.p1  ORF type:complete len:183 (-),score=23.06 TRINITY_DN1866_c2_g1_i2:9-557(-)